jgi:hypothetical protein
MEAASYVDGISGGSSPAELPVQQPTKLSLIINLKTAKALGLTIPERVLDIADEVIEPKSGSWVIATMGRIGAFDGDEHNSFDAFASPGG